MYVRISMFKCNRSIARYINLILTDVHASFIQPVAVAGLDLRKFAEEQVFVRH